MSRIASKVWKAQMHQWTHPAVTLSTSKWPHPVISCHKSIASLEERPQGERTSQESVHPSELRWVPAHPVVDLPQAYDVCVYPVWSHQDLAHRREAALGEVGESLTEGEYSVCVDLQRE